jgi:peptidoglycan/LPS O-acetylase OafA/YrhL
MDRNERYQPEVDGLRTIAIMPVVHFHAGALVITRLLVCLTNS